MKIISPADDWDDDNQPALPYANTSGWSGTDTSEDRARTADNDGRTSQRQTDTLKAVRHRGSYGMTVAEVRDTSGWHHGTASGVLSVLHMVGRLERLVEKRGRCHVYVHPDFVQGRDTQPHGRAGTVTISQEEYDYLTQRAAAHQRR